MARFGVHGNSYGPTAPSALSYVQNITSNRYGPSSQAGSIGCADTASMSVLQFLKALSGMYCNTNGGESPPRGGGWAKASPRNKTKRRMQYRAEEDQRLRRLEAFVREVCNATMCKPFRGSCAFPYLPANYGRDEGWWWLPQCIDNVWDIVNAPAPDRDRMVRQLKEACATLAQDVMEWLEWLDGEASPLRWHWSKPHEIFSSGFPRQHCAGESFPGYVWLLHYESVHLYMCVRALRHWGASSLAELRSRAISGFPEQSVHNDNWGSMPEDELCWTNGMLYDFMSCIEGHGELPDYDPKVGMAAFNRIMLAMDERGGRQLKYFDVEECEEMNNEEAWGVDLKENGRTRVMNLEEIENGTMDNEEAWGVDLKENGRTRVVNLEEIENEAMVNRGTRGADLKQNDRMRETQIDELGDDRVTSGENNGDGVKAWVARSQDDAEALTGDARRRMPISQELLFSRVGASESVENAVEFAPAMDEGQGEFVRQVGMTDRELREGRCDAVMKQPEVFDTGDPRERAKTQDDIDDHERDDDIKCAYVLLHQRPEHAAESLSDTGATSILFTPESARRLGLRQSTTQPGVTIKTAGGHMLHGEKVDRCAVSLKTSDGTWRPFVFEDAHIVQELVQDIAGGPAVSQAGFTAVYESFNNGAYLQHYSGMTVPMKPCQNTKPGHYTIEMRPVQPEVELGCAVTRAQANKNVESDVSVDEDKSDETYNAMIDVVHQEGLNETERSDMQRQEPVDIVPDPQREEMNQANRNAGGASEVLTSDEARRAAMMYHHARFNHCSADRLNQMVNEGVIKNGMRIAAIKCAPCEKANATRSPHTGGALPVSKGKVGAWVQIDIFGPFDECPITKYRFVFAAIDTSDGTVYHTFLKSKRDAIQGYENLKRMYQKHNGFVEAKHKHKLQLEMVCMDRETSLITANGRVKSTFEEMLHNDNVGLYTAPKHTPEFNSKIEAFWNIMERKAEAAMLYAGVDLKTFRFYAFSHVIDTYNRTPAGANEFGLALTGKAEAPLTTRGVPFDPDKLVPFYAPAVEWVEPKRKGTPHGRHVHIIGYESFIPGTSYQIYNPENGKITATADVRVLKYHQQPGIQIQRMRDPDITDETVMPQNELVREAPGTAKGTAGTNDAGVEVRISGNTAATRTTGASLNPFAGDRLNAQKHKMAKALAMRQSRELISKAKRIGNVRVRYDPRNPKKATGKAGPSLSFLRYEKYKHCQTLDELLEKQRQYFTHHGKSELVMRPADLQFDLAHGYATLIFPTNSFDPDSLEQMEEYAIMAREWAETSSATQIGTREASQAVGFPMHLTAFAALLVSEVPIVRNVAEAEKSRHWEQWKAARKKELLGLAKRGMWTVIPREAVPPGRKIFPLKEIYDVKTKLDENGNVVVDKFKHRVTFRGDRSIHGRDYFETASAMARPESVRCCLALAAGNGMSVYSVDHSQAFTNAPRDVEIFTELPEMTPEEEQETGLIGKCKAVVGKMGKTLYGERGSGRAWMQMYDRWLVEELGARMLIQDRQVFVWQWQGHTMYLPTHVDDTLMIASDKAIVDEFMRRLRLKFEVTGGELATDFLGMQIEQGKQGIRIHQTKYAHSLMEKFDMWNTTPAETPIEPNEKYVPHEGDPVDQAEYLMKVGALNWLATSTRPDLAFAMSRLARASRCPGPVDHAMLQRTLRYVRGTLDMGIMYHARVSSNHDRYALRNKLVAAVDSNFYHNGDKAISGSVCMLN